MTDVRRHAHAPRARGGGASGRERHRVRARTKWRRRPSEAADAAARIGFPVVLKVVLARHRPQERRRGRGHGPRRRAAAVRDGFDDLIADVHGRRPEARLDGVLVCRQVEARGAEMIVGAVRDATFGPTVMLGAGGVLTEVLGDVAFRLAPLHRDDALDMLRELRAFKMLTGYRDVPPSICEALLDRGREARRPAVRSSRDGRGRPEPGRGAPRWVRRSRC